MRIDYNPALEMYKQIDDYKIERKMPVPSPGSFKAPEYGMKSVNKVEDERNIIQPKPSNQKLKEPEQIGYDSSAQIKYSNRVGHNMSIKA
jgi:hypothetical protein